MVNKISIERLNKTLSRWGCHYQVYDFDGYTIEELLMQFFYKINEVIKIVEEYSNLIGAIKEWIEEEGLQNAVNKKLDEMAEDGTLSDIINQDIFESLRDEITDMKSEINNFMGEVNGEIEKFTDYLHYPQCTKPSKLGTMNNTFKIVQKTGNDRLRIIQKTNKGYVIYNFDRNTGASVPGRDYGEKHELLRIVHARQLGDVYLYKTIDTPKSGSYEGILYPPSDRNQVEQLLCYTPKYGNSKNVSTKSGGHGLGCYQLKYGNSVTFDMEVTTQGKANICFLGTPSSSENIKVYVNNVLVKTFNPRLGVTDRNAIGIVEFEVPMKSTGNELFEIKIENASETGYFNMCCLNFKKLNEYNREYVTDYKGFGTTDDGWITASGASDYAIHDADNRLWFGSYHGGEEMIQQSINWVSNKIPDHDYNYSKTDLDSISIGEWCLNKNFEIYQRTRLANGNAEMISIFSFMVDGTLDMDFSYYKGKLNLDNFYTALTCTETSFEHVLYPQYITLGSPDDSYIPVACVEGKVSQVSVKQGLQLDNRFTRFNDYRTTRKGVVIANNSAYRKLYYSPIYGNKYLVTNLNFSKSLDFIVR